MSCTSSNLTSGFIDLATFDELEKYMYGGCDATAYFVRDTTKSTWFTQVPVVLSRASGSADFGQDWSVTISRAGDYLLQTWLRVVFPQVFANVAVGAQFGANTALRWTRNLMHNLVREACISFNDLVAARFDHYHLDFWAAFTTPAGKRNGYNNMIGNLSTLTTAAAPGNTLPSTALNLPLPFFYTRDSGVALPTAALPYNDMRISFAFRDWTQLLIAFDASLGGANDVNANTPATTASIVGGVAPTLNGNVQVWANYAIVSNDERKRMACAPRDILIEQVQTAPRQNFLAPVVGNNNSYDIRFSHAIKVLFFAVRNTTYAASWSNYTSASAVYDSVGLQMNYTPTASADPLLDASLVYESTNRLTSMPADFYSLVDPWYKAPDIPLETGYHAYSYSLDFYCLDPMGSTNYGKLTNISIVATSSAAAVAGATGNGPDGTGITGVQTYQLVLTGVNSNIVRVSGGALGFPVL